MPSVHSTRRSWPTLHGTWRRWMLPAVARPSGVCPPSETARQRPVAGDQHDRAHPRMGRSRAGVYDGFVDIDTSRAGATRLTGVHTIAVSTRMYESGESKAMATTAPT